MSDCASPTPRDRAASTKVCWVSRTGGNSSRPTREPVNCCNWTKPIGWHATYLVRDGLVLELLAYSHRVLRAGSDRVMDQVGLTHLSLSVSDLSRVLATVEGFGGSVVEGTVSEQSAMIRDPDGQLLELLSDSWLAILPPRP